MLLFGSAYQRIANGICSETTLRRRRDEWIAVGVMGTVLDLVLIAFDRMIRMELAKLMDDKCIARDPCGGELAGSSPVDRSKRGLKRSLVVDAVGLPLATVEARKSIGPDRHACLCMSRANWTIPTV